MGCLPSLPLGRLKHRPGIDAATVQVAHDCFVLLQAQHPSWSTDPTVCHNALLTRCGGIAIVLNGSLHGRGVSGRAGLGDQEAALVLHSEGLGQGGHFARLPSFQEFRFVLKSKRSLQNTEPAITAK